MFSRLDTIILRVRDLVAAQSWYARHLGLNAIYTDAEQGLAVLGLQGDTSVTLWALSPGEPLERGSTFPILAVVDALAAHRRLLDAGVDVAPVVDARGVRYFRFSDGDGNPLQACQVLG